ncbi:MAG TPA: HIT family protein [Allosphingosinicella sp.]
MSNETMRRFGYPNSLVVEYEHWAVLVRPDQPTLGSLVLASTSEARAFSELPPEAFAQLRTAVSDIEAMLAAAVRYEKINYLMLMMVDPHVHWHVIPRYEGSREHGGLSIADSGWPKLPDLGEAVKLDDAQVAALRDWLRSETYRSS